MQMMIFFILGLLSFPSRLAAVWLPALVIAFVLTFISRPLSVFLLLTPLHVPFRQQAVISWAGLRGAASIVFAIMVFVRDIPLQTDLFHMVFCVVLLSLLLQGSLLPWFSEKAEMINKSGNVLMTFNDYTDEIDIHYISLPIKSGHPWIGKSVQALSLPPETLLVFLKRTGQNLIPKGDTIIEQNDILVLSAFAYQDDNDIRLKEVTITLSHRWCGKRLYELDIPSDMLIILIRRGSDLILPDGQTRLCEGDIVVLNSM